MVMFNDRGCVAVFAGVAESVTMTVKFDVPDTRGVPEIAPAELKVRLAGRVLPAANVQVYGGVPPVAARLGGA